MGETQLFQPEPERTYEVHLTRRDLQAIWHASAALAGEAHEERSAAHNAEDAALARQHAGEAAEMQAMAANLRHIVDRVYGWPAVNR